MMLHEVFGSMAMYNWRFREKLLTGDNVRGHDNCCQSWKTEKAVSSDRSPAKVERCDTEKREETVEGGSLIVSCLSASLIGAFQSADLQSLQTPTAGVLFIDTP